MTDSHSSLVPSPTSQQLTQALASHSKTVTHVFCYVLGSSVTILARLDNDDAHAISLPQQDRPQSCVPAAGLEIRVSLTLAQFTRSSLEDATLRQDDTLHTSSLRLTQVRHV